MRFYQENKKYFMSSKVNQRDPKEVVFLPKKKEKMSYNDVCQL